MDYLRKSEIVFINLNTVKRHGGNFVPPNNFLNEHSLDYLVETVKSEMFGGELYPTIAEKAGLYMFNIVANHIFSDGNKRTGLESAILFLRLNNYNLADNLKTLQLSDRSIPESESTSHKILENFTLEVASGKVSLIECQKWFELNIMKN